jgi:hypothetical protein
MRFVYTDWTLSKKGNKREVVRGECRDGGGEMSEIAVHRRMR